jgi:hypothetical protein
MKRLVKLRLVARSHFPRLTVSQLNRLVNQLNRVPSAQTRKRWRKHLPLPVLAY